ncbi:MAG TPA: ribosome recycling factor [Clostridium sp.]|jgi:ribosome recycling factor|uniref:Ribosome-recycling factor n=1 Tax=Clostridium lapidicellarium TaxID=3240931 RepID=A0ABV4DUB3_9CLOT|nr:ribosome recycling factor [uncultured Clostridium sp.]NLU08344.1 ribosome recycling factor [Clostridiales bacterium]HBC97674.1 ribosome recycling factor [Clostridium sp.]
MIKDTLKDADRKMGKTIESLKRELASMKAGRANPAILDRIEAEYYGKMTPINQMGNISVPEARMLVIQPWDKNALKAIEKAILKSDLGINPSNDGEVIRLVIPELTEETRRELVKKIKRSGENSKVAIRSVRRDGNDKFKELKKENDISEDEIKKAEAEIQKKTDRFIKDIDDIVEKKEREVMSL